NEYAAFLQDEWKVSRRFTLSLGARYDLQDIAQPQVRNPDPQLAAAGIDTSFIHNDKNNFAPRVGFSYTPDPKTVLRGGYGLFYGRTPSIMIGTAHSGNAVNVQTITFTGALVPKYPSVFATIPTGASLPRPSIQFFDPDFQNPEVHQASLGLERALGNDVAVAVSYLFVAGRKLALSRDFSVGAAVQNDVWHSIVLSGYWNIGFFKDSGTVAKALLDGWSMSWIATAFSGYPYSELVTNDLNGDGNRSNDMVPGSRDTHRLPWTK